MTSRYLSACAAFFRKPFFSHPRTLFGLWMLLAVIAAIAKMKPERCNNFLIFKGTFWHTWNGTSLYAAYPQEYFDVNHYGPFFSLLIAPFAVTPHVVGLTLWLLFLTLLLWLAVRHAPLSERQQIFIYWFCAHELLTALYMQQFNIAIAAIIVLTYTCIERERDFMAAFWIMLGTFVKLYGIVGLAFFFFSRQKGRLVGGLLFWAVVMFVAPMLLSSPDYVVQQYGEWYRCLVEKNGENFASIAQNISVMGMVHRISGLAFSDLYILLPAVVMFLIPYLRLSQYRHAAFRQTLLASVLMMVVLFSTGSESSGYIIPFVGIVIWYTAAPWRRTGFDVALLVFAFILSSLSPSDLFPASLRKEWVQPYALKALPVFIIWLKLCYEIYLKDYAPRSSCPAE